MIFIGQRLLQTSSNRAPDTGQDSGGGGGGGNDHPDASPNSNPDSSDTRNLVLQNLEAVHSSQQQLLQLWHHKKLKLDQCFQLRLFEQDCEKVRCQHIFYLITASLLESRYFVFIFLHIQPSILSPV